MYKKITHLITEEHYDHPMAADVKKSVETGVPMPVTETPVKPKSVYVVQEQPMINLSQFEKDNIYAWSTLASRLQDLVVSISSAGPDTAYLVAQAGSDVATLGKSLAPLATEEQITQFNTAAGAWAAALMSVVVDTASGVDPTENMAKLMSIIADIGTFLNSLSTMWDSTAVTNIFTSVSNLYIEQARARVASDWSSSWAAADGAYKVLVSGTVDGTPGLADIFAQGIINC